MKRIVFVCHGNICRSPMAEFVMKDLITASGLEDTYDISSAATSAEEWGNPMHRGTRSILHEKKIPFTTHTARQLRKSDYEAFDLFVGMDRNNLRNMHRLFGGDPQNKIRLLLDYVGESRDIADPWYTHDFDTTFRDVEQGCRALLSALEAAEE